MNTAEPTGTVDAALARAAKILRFDPRLAAEQALEILKAIPRHPPALLLLAVARRQQGDPQAALNLIEPLVAEQPGWIAAHFECALALAAVGRGAEAVKCLQRTVELKPDHTEAWRVLGDHMRAIGDNEAADAAYARHIACSARSPMLRQAAAAMLRDDLPVAERILKSHLASAPTDVPAIRMLAEVAVRCGHEQDAFNLLLRCLELAPSFAAARFNYAILLHRRNDFQAAIAEVKALLAAEPRNPSYRNLLAVILSKTGEYERSGEIYSELLREYGGSSKIWLSYGHVLKTAGRYGECIRAYRESIDLDPAFGEAYWSLANLKTFQFSSDDLATMHGQLSDSRLSDENRIHMHFALGKAYEDVSQFVESFEQYSKGNELYRARIDYDADLNATRLQRLKRAFTRQVFEQRAGQGCDSAAPIFIVGMPRSGSTLLEQILSCHSRIEGTSELTAIITLAKELREEAGTEEVAAYAEPLLAKGAGELRELGEQYIELTRIHRKTDRPFFIDKMPNNFLHIGMIQLALPNAKIIDARRHPLACCWSNFKQYYARGQNFSYSQEDLGRFYRDYVDLMAHFEQALPPGRIHRVFYERTVADTEAVVREVLAYCGLDFESQCLRFHESQRPVRTASSEQVRLPMYTKAIEQWRHYEEWLGPLKRELREVLDVYPRVPVQQQEPALE